MKIIKRIISILVILITLSVNAYAKYNYTYELNAFSLTRDDSEITYTITRTEADKQYTNKDVTLTIQLNKPVDKVEGFEISSDGKTLTRIVKENESKTIVVRDASGNTKEIPYSIDNIDKIPPEIIGVENGKTYNKNMTLDYKDNVGIASIYVDKYSSLKCLIYPDYYDTSFYKGIDLTSNSIFVNVTGHPKGTINYKYYLNGNLKAKTEKTNYKFTGLSAGTTYTVKIEAVDKNDKVLQTVSETVTTKYFADIQTEKGNNYFKVTLYGIDSRVQKAIGVGYTNDNNRKYIYPKINSDRSVSITFYALDVTPNLIDGYYYFHIHLYDNENCTKLYETVCCNVIFNTNYVKKEPTSIDPYNLNSNGNYEITVTDLAGNVTTKNITIQK